MFESLAGALRGSAPDRLAQVLGADSRDTRRAMEVSLPALIGGLRDKTLDEGGGADLLELLSEDTTDTSDLEAVLTSGDARTGAAMLDRVFGERGETALTALSKASGLPTRLLARVMSMMAPVATAWLANKQREDDMDEAAVSRFLAEEVGGLEEQGYGKVLSLLGGSAAGVAAVAAVAEEATGADSESAAMPVTAGVGAAAAGAGAASIDGPGIHIGSQDDLVEVDAEDLPYFDETDDDDQIVGGGGGWLWWLIAAVALIAFFALLISQCTGEDDNAVDTLPTATAEANDSIPATEVEQTLETTIDRVNLDTALAPFPGITGVIDGDTVILEGAVDNEAWLLEASAAVLTVPNVVNVDNRVQLEQTNSLGDIIARNPGNFSSLDTLLAEANLGDALGQTGPFTIFAPVNFAFDAMTDLDDVRADPARLSEVLRYHVVEGTYTDADLADVDLLATLFEGQSIKVSQDAEGAIVLNDLVTIAQSVNDADNGVLHIVTGVLRPSSEGGITAPSELGAALELEPITFELGSSTLATDSELELDRVVEYLLENPQVIEIAGHTDSDGPADYNQTLSQERADAVRQYLINSGIPEDSITAAGFGDTDPIAANDTAANKALNRRIEFNLDAG